MKYGSKNNIFGLKMTVKSSLEIFILKSLHKHFFGPFDLIHKREDFCLKLPTGHHVRSGSPENLQNTDC